MKRIILFFSAWIILFSAVAETKITVYVSGQIEEENIKKVFASKIVTAITKVPDYTAVELNENFIGSIRDEHSRQTGGEVSPDDIIEINKKYGSNYIAAIELTVLFDEYFVTSHLIEAETTKIIQAYDTSGPINNMAQLTTLANNVADGLIIAPLREA
ncbi:MAG: hypothetical protein K2G67_02865 [Muribaculaceae bacterium]|nr:hypothetical protein [Muribaculaceae bacterium]